jgi:hypothetical protein
MGKDSAGEWTAIALAAVRDDDSKEDNGVTNGEQWEESRGGGWTV